MRSLGREETELRLATSTAELIAIGFLVSPVVCWLIAMVLGVRNALVLRRLRRQIIQHHPSVWADIGGRLGWHRAVRVEIDRGVLDDNVIKDLYSQHRRLVFVGTMWIGAGIALVALIVVTTR